MPILTPIYPSMNSAHGVSTTTFRALSTEIARAAAITREQMGPEPRCPTDFRSTANGSGGSQSGSDTPADRQTETETRKEREALGWWHAISRPILADLLSAPKPQYTHYLEVAARFGRLDSRTHSKPHSQPGRQQWEELCLASLRQLVRRLEASRYVQELRPLPPYACSTDAIAATAAVLLEETEEESAATTSKGRRRQKQQQQKQQQQLQAWSHSGSTALAFSSSRTSSG